MDFSSIPTDVLKIIKYYKHQITSLKKFKKTLKQIETLKAWSHIIDDNYIERIWGTKDIFISVEVCGCCGNYHGVSFSVNPDTMNKSFCGCLE